MDLTKQLQAYEVEYQVLDDELQAPSDFSQHQRAAHLEKVYQSLQQQNSQLQEELQVQTHTNPQLACAWTLCHVLAGFINFILCSGVTSSRLQPGETNGEFGPV